MSARNVWNHEAGNLLSSSVRGEHIREAGYPADGLDVGGAGNILWVDRAVVAGSHGGRLAPLLVEEEEALVLVGVVDMRNVDRAADIEAVDVVMRCRPRIVGAVVLVEEGVGVVGGGAIKLPMHAPWKSLVPLFSDMLMVAPEEMP